MTENELAKILVNLFLKVHKTLGPGLLESVYEAAINLGELCAFARNINIETPIH